MIEIKYSEISGHAFSMALQKLMGTTTDGKSAYRIKKIFAEIRKGRDQIAKEYKAEIQPEFAKKDAEGKYDPENFECAEGKEKELDAAQDKFGERTFKVDRPKLTMSDIRDAKLTPADQLALEPILDDSQAEAEPKVPNVGGMRAVN